jgi:hypothetical protein
MFNTLNAMDGLVAYLVSHQPVPALPIFPNCLLKSLAAAAIASRHIKPWHSGPA